MIKFSYTNGPEPTLTVSSKYCNASAIAAIHTERSILSAQTSVCRHFG